MDTLENIMDTGIFYLWWISQGNSFDRDSPYSFNEWRGVPEKNEKYGRGVGEIFHSGPSQDVKWNNPYVNQITAVVIIVIPPPCPFLTSWGEI